MQSASLKQEAPGLDPGGAFTVAEFCQACGEMLRGEGWTGYQAIQAAWTATPVDCSQYLQNDLLS